MWFQVWPHIAFLAKSLIQFFLRFWFFWFGGILSRKLTDSLTKDMCFFSRPKETSWNYMWSLQHRNWKFCNGIEVWKEHPEDHWSFDWWCLLYGKQYTLIWLDFGICTLKSWMLNCWVFIYVSSENVLHTKMRSKSY